MKHNGIEYETEEYSEDNPVDMVWVRDGRGNLIKLEMADDVGDD